jgi:hypothetical protein
MEPLTGLVLYRTPQGWQFAISAGGGIVDGRLPDTPLAADDSETQAVLLGLIEEWSGRTVQATWRSDQPDWWTADASFVPSSR